MVCMRIRTSFVQAVMKRLLQVAGIMLNDFQKITILVKIHEKTTADCHITFIFDRLRG